VSGARDARVAVVGSANVDVVVRCARLPRPGETVLASDPVRLPGGKAANQAAALAALSIETALVAQVGNDDAGEWVSSILRDRGVDLSLMQRGALPTGTAYITVDDQGENIIVVARGANATLDVSSVDFSSFDVVLAQMEVDEEVVGAVIATAPTTILNVAPARPVPLAWLQRCAVIIANEHEAESLDLTTLPHCVVTLGAKGAVHYNFGAVVAEATPPSVTVVDTVGAGDVFCAAYTAAYVAAMPPAEALRFAVTAGALATQSLGAQGALPTVKEVLSWIEPA
jgi:ribokinase